MAVEGSKNRFMVSSPHFSEHKSHRFTLFDRGAVKDIIFTIFTRTVTDSLNPEPGSVLEQVVT